MHCVKQGACPLGSDLVAGVLCWVGNVGARAKAWTAMPPGPEMSGRMFSENAVIAAYRAVGVCCASVG